MGRVRVVSQLPPAVRIIGRRHGLNLEVNWKRVTTTLAICIWVAGLVVYSFYLNNWSMYWNPNHPLVESHLVPGWVEVKLHVEVVVSIVALLPLGVAVCIVGFVQVMEWLFDRLGL